MSQKPYENNAKINTEAVKNSFLNNGGSVETKPLADGRTHTSCHFNEKGRKDRCSWNEDSDGNITDVHTTRTNGKHTDYTRGGY